MSQASDDFNKENTSTPYEKYITDAQWQAIQSSSTMKQFQSSEQELIEIKKDRQLGKAPIEPKLSEIEQSDHTLSSPNKIHPEYENVVQSNVQPGKKEKSFEDFINSMNNIRKRVFDKRPEAKISKFVTIWFISLFIFLFFMLLINVALTTWSGILAIGAISSLDEAEVVATIGKTLTAQPFYDFEVVQSSQECSSGFRESPFGHWVGSKKSCNCDGNPTVLDQSQVGQDDYVSYKCPVIEKIEPIPLYIWKNYKLCLKQYSKQFTLTTQRQSCQFDQKKCFDYLCVPFHDECPITYLEWSNTIPSSTTSYKPFGSIGYLIYKRGGVSSQISWEDKEEPLIAFGIDQEGKICLMDGYTNKKDPQYSLLSSGGCGIQGERTKIIQIDTIKEPTLYDQNSLEQSVYNVLPGYKDFVQNANQDMTWVSIPRFKLQQNSICMNQNLYENIVDLKDDAQDGFGTQVAIIIMGLLMTLFNCCTIGFFSCCFTGCCRKGINLKKDKSFILASVFTQIIVAPIIISLFAKGQNYKEVVVEHSQDFQIIQSNKCFADDNLNKVVDKYYTDFINNSDMIWTILSYPYGLSVVILVLTLLTIILIIIVAKIKK